MDTYGESDSDDDLEIKKELMLMVLNREPISIVPWQIKQKTMKRKRNYSLYSKILS